MNFGYRISFQTLDKGNIEVFGAFGSSGRLTQLSKNLSSLHSGLIFHYSFAMIIGMIFLFASFRAHLEQFDFNLIPVIIILSYALFVTE
jgi:hypothetical protein